MKSDFLGIKLSFYAVLAFVLTLFNQTLLCGLLLGVSIFVIRDRWLARQVMQAFFLCFVNTVVSILTGFFELFNFIGIGIFSGFMSTIGMIIGLVVLILSIIAIIMVARGQDAGIPGLSALAKKAFVTED